MQTPCLVGVPDARVPRTCKGADVTIDAPSRRCDQYGKMPYSEGAMKPDTQPTARLEARLPPEVMARLKRAAEIQGRTLTDFVVAAAEAACRAIEQRRASIPMPTA
jgi:hypothetical protein